MGLWIGSSVWCLISRMYDRGTSNTGESTSSNGTAAAEQIFNVVVQQEMPSADLSLATDTISFSALNNVYEGLYRWMLTVSRNLLELLNSQK